MSSLSIIQSGIYTIVDVRSIAEFQGGHVVGAINIPLQEVVQRVEELKALTPPLILCCASGNRSGMAQEYLSSIGVDCVNGGGWLEVNALLH